MVTPSPTPTPCRATIQDGATHITCARVHGHMGLHHWVEREGEPAPVAPSLVPLVTTDIATIAAVLTTKTGRVNLPASLRAFRRQAVALALAASPTPNVARAARRLGIGRNTFKRWRNEEGNDAS